MRPAIVLVLTTGCLSKPGPAPTDAVPDAALASGCRTFGAWSAPQPMIELNTDDNEIGAWLSPDGDEIWFSRQGQALMFRSQRTSASASWEAPVDVTALFPTNPDGNAEVFLSDDGKRVWFDHFQSTEVIVTGNRPAASGPFDNAIDATVSMNGVSHTGDPTLTSDELTMVFSRWPTNGSADLEITTRARPDLDWDPPTVLTDLNTTSDDCCGSLNADGTRLLFASSRVGSGRLYEAIRDSSSLPFGPAIVVAGQQQAGADNTSPVLSRDGSTLIYSSDRHTGASFDLYQMTRVCLGP